MEPNNEEMKVSRDRMIALVIGGRYSIDDQIALLRQRETKPEEFEEFNAFAEEVKKKVTEEYATYAVEEDGE